MVDNLTPKHEILPSNGALAADGRYPSEREGFIPLRAAPSIVTRAWVSLPRFGLCDEPRAALFSRPMPAPRTGLPRTDEGPALPGFGRGRRRRFLRRGPSSSKSKSTPWAPPTPGYAFSVRSSETPEKRVVQRCGLGDLEA